MVSDTTIDGYYLGKDGAWDGKAVSNSDNLEDTNFKDIIIIMKAERDTYELGTEEINAYITDNGKNSVYYGLEY